jgi:hypothetical protein
MMLDSDTTGATGQIRLLRRANIPGNPIIGADDCVFECIINEHALRTVTTW